MGPYRTFLATIEYPPPPPAAQSGLPPWPDPPPGQPPSAALETKPVFIISGGLRYVTQNGLKGMWGLENWTMTIVDDVDLPSYPDGAFAVLVNLGTTVKVYQNSYILRRVEHDRLDIMLFTRFDRWRQSQVCREGQLPQESP